MQVDVVRTGIGKQGGEGGELYRIGRVEFEIERSNAPLPDESIWVVFGIPELSAAGPVAPATPGWM